MHTEKCPMDRQRFNTSHAVLWCERTISRHRTDQSAKISQINVAYLGMMGMQRLKSWIAYVWVGAHREHMTILFPDPRHLKRKNKIKWICVTFECFECSNTRRFKGLEIQHWTFVSDGSLLVAGTRGYLSGSHADSLLVESSPSLFYLENLNSVKEPAENVLPFKWADAKRLRCLAFRVPNYNF